MVWPVPCGAAALATTQDRSGVKEVLVTTERRMTPPRAAVSEHAESTAAEVGGGTPRWVKAGGGRRIRLSGRQRSGCGLIEVDYRAMAVVNQPEPSGVVGPTTSMRTPHAHP